MQLSIHFLFSGHIPYACNMEKKHKSVIVFRGVIKNIVHAFPACDITLFTISLTLSPRSLTTAIFVVYP